MPKHPNAPGKWLLHPVAGAKGEGLVSVYRWPVDAVEMIRRGFYVRDSGDAASPPVSPGLNPESIKDNPVPHVAAAEAALAHNPHNLLNAPPQEPAPWPPEGGTPAERLKAAEEAAEAAEEVPADPAPEVPEWGMKQSPKDYLKRHKTGPNADRARAILGIE